MLIVLRSPLSQATWEPKENLDTEESTVLADWALHEEKVKRGEAERFNLQDYERAVGEYGVKKAERARRRKIKRRKKGLPLRSSTEASEESDSDTRSKPRQRSRSASVQRSTPKRKGVAQRVPKKRLEDEGSSSSSESGLFASSDGSRRRARSAPRKRSRRVKDSGASSDGSHESSSSDSSSGGDSFLEEIASKAGNQKASSASESAKSASKPPRPKQQSQSAASAASKTKPPARPTQPKQPSTARDVPASSSRPLTSQGTSSVTMAKTASVAKKTKPVIATKSKNIMSKWGEEKGVKKRPGFTHELKGNQKALYGFNSRTERAPDVNALNLIDPKTGKAVPRETGGAQQARATTETASARDVETEPRKQSLPVSAPAPSGQRPADDSVKQGDGRASVSSTEIHSAYGRRSPPPSKATRDPETVARRVSLPTEPAGELPTAYSRRSPPPAAIQRQRSSSPPPPPPQPQPPTSASSSTAVQGSKGAPTLWQTTTCRHWLSGTCSLTKETCSFAHWYIEHEPQWDMPFENQMCFFWYNKGKCSRADCAFAHHKLDTGVVAKPPPGYGQLPPRREAPPERELAAIPKSLTCWYWSNGHCKKPESMCDYAHHDTGQIASRPGTFRKSSRPSSTFLPSQAQAETAQAMFGSSANAVPIASRLESTETIPHRKSMDSHTDSRHALNVQASSFLGSPEHTTASPMYTAMDTALSKPTESIREATIELLHNGSVQAIRVQAALGTDNKTFDDVGPVQMKIERTILASDFEHLLLQAKPDSTDMIGAIRAAEPSELEGLIGLCELYAGGLVAVVEGVKAKVILFPAHSMHWRFIQGTSAASQSNEMRFAIVHTLPDVTLSGANYLTQLDMRSTLLIAAEQIARIDFAARISNRTEAVFLMITPEAATELDFYTQIARARSNKVFDAATKGAWSYFRRNYKARACLIVLHPSVNLRQIPGWHDFVMSSSPHTQFYDIEMGRSWYVNGTAVLISDDVFMYHPEKATKAIQHYLDATAHKPEGNEFNRIVARPGLKDWLLETYIERGRPEAKWIDLYGAICDLLPPEAEDLEGNPLPDAHLVCPSSEEINRFTALNNSNRAAAQEALVNWFAAWAAVGEMKFRRVIICHEPERKTTTLDENARKAETVDTRGWAKKYQNVGVLSPEEVVSKERKILPPAKRAGKTRDWLTAGQTSG